MFLTFSPIIFVFVCYSPEKGSRSHWVYQPVCTLLLLFALCLYNQNTFLPQKKIRRRLMLVHAFLVGRASNVMV